MLLDWFFTQSNPMPSNLLLLFLNYSNRSWSNRGVRQRAKLPMRELQIMWNEWWNSGSWNERLMWCMFKGGARVPRPLGCSTSLFYLFFFLPTDEYAVTSLAKITKTYFHIHVACGHVRERNGSLSSIGGNRTTFLLMFEEKNKTRLKSQVN